MSWQAETSNLLDKVKALGIDLGSEHDYMDEDGDYDEYTLPHLVEKLIAHIEVQNKASKSQKM